MKTGEKIFGEESEADVKKIPDNPPPLQPLGEPRAAIPPGDDTLRTAHEDIINMCDLSLGKDMDTVVGVRQFQAIKAVVYDDLAYRDAIDKLESLASIDPDKPVDMVFPAGEANELLTFMLFMLPVDKPELFQVQNRDDDTAWGVDGNPYGYVCEGGDCALVQRFLSWKKRTENDVDFETFKLMTQEARENQYSRDEENTGN